MRIQPDSSHDAVYEGRLPPRDLNLKSDDLKMLTSDGVANSRLDRGIQTAEAFLQGSDYTEARAEEDNFPLAEAILEESVIRSKIAEGATQELVQIELMIAEAINNNSTTFQRPNIEFAPNGDISKPNLKTVLPEGVRGAFVPGTDGKPGTILLSEGLKSNPELSKKVVLEEFGEAIADHLSPYLAENDLAFGTGDVGHRLMKVFTNQGLDSNDFEADMTGPDEQDVRFEGSIVSAKTAAEETPTMAEADLSALSLTPRLHTVSLPAGVSLFGDADGDGLPAGASLVGGVDGDGLPTTSSIPTEGGDEADIEVPEGAELTALAEEWGATLPEDEFDIQEAFSKANNVQNGHPWTEESFENIDDWDMVVDQYGTNGTLVGRGMAKAIFDDVVSLKVDDRHLLADNLVVSRVDDRRLELRTDADYAEIWGVDGVLPDDHDVMFAFSTAKFVFEDHGLDTTGIGDALDANSYSDTPGWEQLVTIYGQEKHSEGTESEGPGALLRLDDLARAIVDGAVSVSASEDGQSMIITGVDLSKVSNGALTDSIWRMTERNTGGHRVQMGEGLLVTAAAEITGDPDGFVTDADKLAIQSNFADVTFGDVATPNRYSKEAIQNIWDQEGFVRGDATADAINFSVDPSLVGASANGDEPVLDVTSDAPVWELYGVTETHYNNTLATVEEYLEQHQSGDLFVGLDTYPPENIDFHSLLKVYGDQTLDYQMDAVDITRAILDGAMSIPHQTLAVGAQPLTTNIDSVSSTSFALQFFDEARATHYPDRTTPLTELKAGEVNGALNRIGGGSDFNDLTSADFPDLIAGFADVAVDGETTSFSYAAVKRLFNDGVFTRPETAEDAGGIPIAVDREVLSSYASEDTEGNFVGELPTEDAVYTTNEDLETILSAFPGTMTVGTVDIEIVDDIAFENVGEALENLTPTDAPELHHFNQLMQLKTLANDPVRGKQIDIDAVDADITLLLQTEPVTAMYNEAHEVAVLEHFGVGSPEMSAEFTEFATSRSTLQSILRLGEESREFVVNHLVAIAARFDPDGAAKFSEELLPLLIGESIEYAEENGRLLQDGDSVEVVDGETVPTAEAQEKRASSVERWLTYLVSTGRNIGGSNLEWTASIRNLSQSDFKVLTDLVARHSILESAGEDVGELGAYVTANADEFIHDIEDVTALKASGQAMSEASSNGTLPAAWGLLAGISLGLDGYNATQKDELTAADSVQIAADFMQFASGVYGGRHAFAKAGALIADIANEKIINPVLQVLRGAPETEAQELLTTLAEMRNSTDSVAKVALVEENLFLQQAFGLDPAAADFEPQALANLNQFFEDLNEVEATGNYTAVQFLETRYAETNGLEWGTPEGGTTISAQMNRTRGQLLIAAGEENIEIGENLANAAAEEVAGAGFADGAIMGERAGGMLETLWADNAVGLQKGISAASMESVGVLGTGMGVLGGAANFGFSFVEADKAISEAEAGHELLAGLHGLMAADFAVIGAASTTGAVAGAMGVTGYAAVAAATAGWGVVVLIALQLAVAIAEETDRQQEKDELDDSLEAETEGEHGREQFYYYSRSEPDLWDPDPTW